VTATEALLLVLAGLAAGGVNAVAGGGSLVSFPALLAIGLPPLAANVTNSVALWPGYVGSSWGYRELLRPQRSRLGVLAPAAVLGAVLGCLLLLVTSEEAFARVVPWLVIVGALLLAVQGRVTERAVACQGRGVTSAHRCCTSAWSLRRPTAPTSVVVSASCCSSCWVCSWPRTCSG